MVDHFERMGHMGQVLVASLRERHRSFSLRPELDRQGDPWDLPPLSAATAALAKSPRTAAPVGVVGVNRRSLADGRRSPGESPGWLVPGRREASGGPARAAVHLDYAGRSGGSRGLRRIHGDRFRWGRGGDGRPGTDLRLSLIHI